MGRISTKLQYVRSARRLYGPRMGMTSLLHHLAHRNIGAYYEKLVEASWNCFMKDLPFDADAIATLPVTNDGPIWVMWWQGLDGSEPPIVRACVDSIKRHANGREVRLITKNTVDQYASLDPSIMRKVHEGAITLTTLSDIVRFARHANGREVRLITKNTVDQYASLDPSIMRKVHEGAITLTTLSDIVRFAVLKEHGGMWMDATNTVDQYASLDPSIMRKVHEGAITLTTLSDIVRFAVLKEHGGMWMDATMYLAADLSDDVRRYAFYSIPNHQTAPTRNWTGYFMGGKPGNPLFAYMLQAFTTLYALTDRIPDYFMIDVMMSAAYTHIPQVRSMIDAEPVNNLHRLYLADKLADATVELPSDTYAYKLSYKNTRKIPATHTVYGEVLDGTL